MLGGGPSVSSSGLDFMIIISRIWTDNVQYYIIVRTFMKKQNDGVSFFRKNKIMMK